jgi:hypothetical protein
VAVKAAVLKFFIVAPTASAGIASAPPSVSAARSVAPRAGSEKVTTGFSRGSRLNYQTQLRFMILD